MTKIIGISGKKQSGKNTVANYINGYILQSRGMIQDFTITKDGELKILTSNNSGHTDWGIFDVTRKDEAFINYAESELWPYVKIYHFADYLKQICVELFDLTPKQVYGTDDDKNTDTPYGMTSREFLQYFGTNVMRKIKDTIWVDYTIKTIKYEQSSLSIIPDVRFPNEVHAIKDAGGIIIRLNRDVHSPQHECEKALDEDVFDWSEFDYVIDNQNISVKDLCIKLRKFTNLWSI